MLFSFGNCFFFLLLQVSKDSELQTVSIIRLEIKLFKTSTIYIYNDHLCWFRWWLADKYTCVTLCVFLINIPNLILIFMRLAVITKQYTCIKQYQIPDLLTEFSACNKPFWQGWSNPGIWTVWRSRCGRPSLD